MEIVQFLPENLHHTQYKTNRIKLSMVKFIKKRVDQSHLTMERFTIELVANVSAQLFLYKTLSSFTFCFTGATESGCQVAISGKSYPSRYKIVTEGNFIFSDKKYSKLSEFYYLELSFYPSLTDIVKAINILIQETQNHSEN